MTTTSISVGGTRSAEATPGRSVPLRVDVTSASHGGVVQIEIDRLEPLIGWQFSEVQKGNVSSGGMFTLNWTPPSVGNWRARARFLGTPYSSFSESGYVLNPRCSNRSGDGLRAGIRGSERRARESLLVWVASRARASF